MPAARLFVPVAAMLIVACTATTERPAVRLMSETMAFEVSFDPKPPFAREKIRYKVVVRDRESGKPIENGEGRVYASTREGKSTFDGLVPGTELGTYYGNLNFLTAEPWAVAIQFRRDSTQALEKIEWMQDVQKSRTSEF
jgi:hypothetical protein